MLAPMIMTPVQQQGFELYTDEVEVLLDAAKESGMKELTEAMTALFKYSEQKSNRNRGPVKIKFE